MTRRKLDSTTATAASAVTTATTSHKKSSVSSSTSHSNDISPITLITVTILAIVVILAASIYLLLRFLRRNRHLSATAATADTVVFRHSLSTTSSESSLRRVAPIINSLPLFTYNNNRAGDCAVCLSKFENDDVLRLLPVCCHAFHADCIDTWLSANLTCPLCRSPIILSEIDVIGKLTGERQLSGSFRVEIGNVSNRRPTATSAAVSSVVSAAVSGEIQRSYSIGNSFDYVIHGDDDAIAEVGIPVPEYSKELSVTMEQHREVLATEVGSWNSGDGFGGWLKDYLSFSGRIFFTGSSRRSTVEVNTGNAGYETDDPNRLGDEIHDLFRWLSGN